MRIHKHTHSQSRDGYNRDRNARYINHYYFSRPPLGAIALSRAGQRVAGRFAPYHAQKFHFPVTSAVATVAAQRVLQTSQSVGDTTSMNRYEHLMKPARATPCYFTVIESKSSNRCTVLSVPGPTVRKRMHGVLRQVCHRHGFVQLYSACVGACSVYVAHLSEERAMDLLLHRCEGGVLRVCDRTSIFCQFDVTDNWQPF